MCHLKVIDCMESLHVIDLKTVFFFFLISTVRGMYLLLVTIFYTASNEEMKNMKQTSQAISNTAVGHVRINK